MAGHGRMIQYEENHGKQKEIDTQELVEKCEIKMVMKKKKKVCNEAHYGNVLFSWLH